MGDYVQDQSLTAPTSCFSCHRLNAITFRIKENDWDHEYPFIYVILPVDSNTLVLIDTGCGGTTEGSGIEVATLREFIETYPVADNDHKPLNPESEKAYVVICSHCHYDHILGIEEFARSTTCRVWASSFDKSFVAPENLPTHSLCKSMDISTPKYTITDWAHDDTVLRDRHGNDLGLVLYHTPGHTPDSLTVFDPSRRIFFVGDTVCGWELIIFPKEGNLITYSQSIGKLSRLAKSLNAATTAMRVMVACGHCTSCADAAYLFADVDAFLLDVVDGKVAVKREEERRGETRKLYESENEELSLLLSSRQIQAFKDEARELKNLRERVAKRRENHVDND